MNDKFDFYEIVKIRNDVLKKHKKLKDYQDITGVIKGKSQNDDGSWGYGVFIDITETVWCFEEDELQKTGFYEKPEHSITNEYIKVVVDKNGLGDYKNCDSDNES